MKPSEAAYRAAKILTKSYKNPKRLDAIAAELLEISWAHKKIEARWKIENSRWGKGVTKRKTAEKYDLAVAR